jgi:hypothetical protein
VRVSKKVNVLVRRERLQDDEFTQSEVIEVRKPCR